MEGSPGSPSSTLEAFLAEGIDRVAFISSWLGARDIPHALVPIAGRRHVVVRFPPSAYDPLYRMKTVVAHHDRVGGTPGANDNSAACFQLMRFAERLARWDRERPAGAREAHNVKIVFTDGEEAAGTQGVAGQGSFALGSGFRKLRMTDEDVYVLDATGRGDTLVLSTAALSSGEGSGPARARPAGLASRLAELHGTAARLADRAANRSWITLHTPYSDDAGFLAAGIAAQVVTVLPREEAETLSRAFAEAGDRSPDEKGFSREELERAITLNRNHALPRDIGRVVPETWRLMHTEADRAHTLSGEAFILMDRFLGEIAVSAEALTNPVGSPTRSRA
jgi:hypothetical protein